METVFFAPEKEVILLKFADLSTYEIPGFAIRQLTPEDKPKMFAIRDAVMAVLPDPRWYFSMEEWEIDEWLAARSVVGYLDGDVLAGFGAITPEYERGDHSYARVLGEPAENTFDFHDVMVHPAYRGHRMHQQFLSLFTQSVRQLGGRAVYATVDPENSASWYNFEKEGYRCIVTQPAYDGRDRRYYKLTL